MLEFEALYEQTFRAMLSPGQPKDRIYCLGILQGSWQRRRSPDPPEIEDPPAALIDRLRRCGYELRPCSRAPEPSGEGEWKDPKTGRLAVFKLAWVAPIREGEVEIETVSYHRWMESDGGTYRYVLGPDGWQLREA